MGSGVESGSPSGRRCQDSCQESRSRLTCRHGKTTTCGRSGRAWFSEPRTGDGVSPLAAQARTRSAPTHPLADGPPTPLGRAGQQATDRLGTARRAYQRQPRHTVGRRDLGSAHRAATQPPVNPATTGKTEERVLALSDTSVSLATDGGSLWVPWGGTCGTALDLDRKYLEEVVFYSPGLPRSGYPGLRPPMRTGAL
jgi:hypothetical protein